MTQSPDPRRSRLGFDELIAILVAFGTIGSVIAWSLTRPGGQDWITLDGASPTPSAVAVPSVSPLPTASPSAVLPPVTRPADPPPPVTPVPSPAAPVTPLAAVPVAPAAAPVAESPRAEPAPVASPTASPVSFPDVPENYWARPYIEALAAREILTGFPDGTFQPNDPITRAEFAALVKQAFPPPAKNTAVNFQDVAPDFWAKPVIQTAVSQGYMKGYPRQIFRPNQAIPKVQVFVALANGLKLPVPQQPNQVLQVYPDVAQIPSYATPLMAAATEAGLVVNPPAKIELEPNRNATRAEVAAAVYRALAIAGKVPAQPQ